MQLDPELVEKFEAMLPTYDPDEDVAAPPSIEPLEETEARLQPGSVKHAIFLVLKTSGVQVYHQCPLPSRPLPVLSLPLLHQLPDKMHPYLCMRPFRVTVCNAFKSSRIFFRTGTVYH